jgi:hypothetical protein
LSIGKKAYLKRRRHNILKIIKKERDEKLLLCYVLMTRQITKLSDCIMHIVRLDSNKKDTVNIFNGYKAYIQTELSDIITQIKRMCLILNISFEETVEMANLRDIEKKEEFLKKFPEEHWV